MPEKSTLTELGLRHLKPPASGQMTYWDKNSPIGVRVSQGGSKTFIVLLGSGQRKTLGRHGIISLQEAREAAKHILAERTLGIHRPRSVNFDEARDQFLSTHIPKLRSSSAYQLQRTLHRYFHWKKPLDTITHDDVATVIDGIKAKSEASHALKDIRTFFNWCVPRFVPHSPCQGLKTPQRYTPRSRFLSDEELKAVWKAAEQMGLQFGNLCQLLLTTGQRRNQISSLRWSWINEDDQSVRFPAEVMKGGREHWLPYSDTTATILATIPRQGDLLFPARGKDKPATNQGKVKQTLDTLSGVSGYTIHDLRRTAAVGLQRCGVSVELIETILSHRSGIFGGIVGVYQRHTFQDEMREAIQLWEKRLALLVS